MKIIKRILIPASVFILPGSAWALESESHRGFYVSGLGTYSIHNDVDVVIENGAGPGADLELVARYKDGWGLAGAIGYDFGPARVEAEIGYSENEAESSTITSPFSADLALDGSDEFLRFMANAYADLSLGAVEPYVGGGIGIADVRVTVIGPPPGPPGAPPQDLIRDGESDFAYQLMAGAAFRVGPRARLFGQYRYFDAGEVRGVDTLGQRFSGGVSTHNIEAGLRLTF